MGHLGVPPTPPTATSRLAADDVIIGVAFAELDDALEGAPTLELGTADGASETLAEIGVTTGSCKVDEPTEPPDSRAAMPALPPPVLGRRTGTDACTPPT